jgi:hypothetical protein
MLTTRRTNNGSGVRTDGDFIESEDIDNIEDIDNRLAWDDTCGSMHWHEL